MYTKGEFWTWLNIVAEFGGNLIFKPKFSGRPFLKGL